MNLIMQDGTIRPNAHYTEIFKKAFHLVAKEIGIDQDDYTINAKFFRRGELQGDACIEDEVEFNKEKQIIIEPKHCTMSMSAMPLSCLIAATSHELWHVRQKLRGEFVVKIVPDFQNPQVFFKDEHMPEEAVLYCQTHGLNDSIPFEYEPYAKMYIIANAVIKQLPPEDVEHMKKHTCICNQCQPMFKKYES